MFDVHAHLNFDDFNGERDDIIEKCLTDGIEIINVGATVEDSQKAVEIAKSYSFGVYACVGVHPLHAHEDFDFEKIRELAKSPSVIAIGETGLDYKEKETIEKQRSLFMKHIELAQEIDLPLMLHSRKAHEQVLKVLFDWKGVIHCFSGTLSQARKYIEKGFHVGFNGLIYKMDLEKVIKGVPADKIVLETDCPYLNPPEVSGKNTPLQVREIAKEITEIKKLPPGKLEKVTDENVKEIFDL